MEQFANGSAVFWVTAHLFDAAWKLNCSSILTTDTAPPGLFLDPPKGGVTPPEFQSTPLQFKKKKFPPSSVLTTDNAPLKQLYCWGLTFTFPQIFFAVTATLKSIDYNVAMTFILNNNNNIIIIIIIFMRTKFEVASFNGCRNQYWVCVSMMTVTVCFEQKNICNAKFGDNGDRG